MPEPTAHPDAVSDRPRYAPVLVLAFVLRAAAALPFLLGDTQQKFFNQATELGRLAISLLQGHGLSSPFGGATGPSAFLTPGYPALVAAVFAVFGAYSKASVATLLLLQICFGVLTALVVMRVAKKLFGSRAANIAGFVFALSPPLVFFPTLFWESGLSMLLLISFLALAMHCCDEPRPRNWAFLGAFAALTMLVNPALVFALLSIAAWALYRCRTRCPRAAGTLLAAWLLVYSPWPIRNALTMHAFIPARTNFGYELWQGNRAGANGGFTPALHPNVSRDEFASYQRLGELGYMREKSQIARQAIRDDVPRFVRLTMERAAKFWVGLGTHDPATLVVLYIVATSALALVGLILLFRRNRALAWLFLGPLLLFPVPYYFTHPDFRFRLILEPFALMLTAFVFTHRTKTEPAGRLSNS